MTTVKAPVLVDDVAEHQSPHPDAAPIANVPTHAECGSYKEAKDLASSRRRDGTYASAVFVVALDRWCVR